MVWAAKRVGRPVKWTCERSRGLRQRLPGPRPGDRGRARARRQGQVPGAARLGDLQRRRAQRHVRAAGQVLGVDDRGLSRAGGARARPRHALQHAADQSLPQRRPAGGDVRDRAADRFRRAAVRLRPHRSAPAQPRAAVGAALCQSARHDLRLGRLREGDGPRAGARRLEGLQQAQARSPRRNGRLRGIGLANYIEATSGAPREWSKVDVQPEGRVEVSVGTLSSGQGHETSFAQCVGEWLGVPFDSHPSDPGRHRHRADRRRHALRPLDADGRRGHGQGVGGGDPEGHAHRRPRAGDRRRRRRVFGRPLHREGHRSLDRPVRGGARGARTATTCPRTCAGRSPPIATT